jgi:hypothetical protein
MNALKEWAVVCRALEEGRQVVLLRKGGILEYRQGFEVRHEKFLMFPTFEHQSREHLQPDYAYKLDEVMNDSPPPGKSRMSSYAEVHAVSEISNKSVLKGLERFHVWKESYVNARMDYNPKKPMSVILLRVFKLDSPMMINTKDDWAGCKSWVPVDLDDTGGSKPALNESEFEKRAAEVRGVLSIAA